MTTNLCANCNESLGAVVDSYCPYCGESLDETGNPDLAPVAPNSRADSRFSKSDQNKNTSIGFFTAAIVIASLTLVFAFANVLPALTSDATVADKAGRIAGSLWMAGLFCIAGFGAAAALYGMGMARMYPETHSSAGRLNQIYESTKDFKITDTSKDGFYRNATEFELQNFYSRYCKTGDTARLNAIVLEVRRRLGVSE